MPKRIFRTSYGIDDYPRIRYNTPSLLQLIPGGKMNALPAQIADKNVRNDIETEILRRYVQLEGNVVDQESNLNLILGRLQENDWLKDEYLVPALQRFTRLYLELLGLARANPVEIDQPKVLCLATRCLDAMMTIQQHQKS